MIEAKLLLCQQSTYVPQRTFHVRRRTRRTRDGLSSRVLVHAVTCDVPGYVPRCKISQHCMRRSGHPPPCDCKAGGRGTDPIPANSFILHVSYAPDSGRAIRR